MMTPADLARCGIRVKPLVWNADPQNRMRAYDKWVAEVFDGEGYSANAYGWWFGSGQLTLADNLEEAKAAAEADHVARVCAMLEMMEDGK